MVDSSWLAGGGLHLEGVVSARLEVEGFLVHLCDSDGATNFAPTWLWL